MPKITIIKIIHFTIDFLLAGFYFAFMSIYMTKVVRREQICLGGAGGVYTLVRAHSGAA